MIKYDVEFYSYKLLLSNKVNKNKKVFTNIGDKKLFHLFQQCASVE